MTIDYTSHPSPFSELETPLTPTYRSTKEERYVKDSRFYGLTFFSSSYDVPFYVWQCHTILMHLHRLYMSLVT